MADDRYVHDPDAFEDDAPPGDDAIDEGDADVKDGTSTTDATPLADDADAESASASSAGGERRFDWRNWLLVAALVVSLLVVPAFILYQPVRVNSFVFTYLVLPLVPAFLLGALAVWAATR